MGGDWCYTATGEIVGEVRSRKHEYHKWDDDYDCTNKIDTCASYCNLFGGKWWDGTVQVDWRAVITSPKAYRGLDESSDH